jgi:hypothetical protein
MSITEPAALKNDEWESELRRVWERGLAAGRSGARTPDAMFGGGDAAFLAGIGCTKQELFDFVDDALGWGDVEFETVLAVTAIRRRYFLGVQEGRWTGRVVPMSALPAKSAAVDGIAWLPRLIEKARIKLRGEMDPDLMYGCGGDRPFLRQHGMTLAQFLQLVWDKGDDDRAIIDAFKRAAGLN